MLSKKMAFSLTSLITILALAFVAPIAMAGEFGVSLDTRGDVSTADGFQVGSPIDNILKVVVRFERAVVLPAANITIDGFEMDGDYIPSVALADTNPISPATGARDITLSIKVTSATSKVTLKIAKGIASESFTNEDTSKELKVDIYLVGTDSSLGPQVYEIRREIPSSVPIAPATTAKLNVIITLSERPKAFKKDQIDVSNATFGDPVALTPIAEETDASISRGVLAVTEADLTPARGLYDTAEGDAGIHTAILAAPPMALTAAVTAYNTEAAKDTNVSEVVLSTALATTAPAETSLPYVIPVHAPLKTYTLNVATDGAITVAYPTVAAADSTATPAQTVAGQITAADILANDRAAGAPTKPKPADYASAAEYRDAESFYTALKMVYDLYQAELKLHQAYMNAVQVEKDKDEAIRDAERAAHGERIYRATGRTEMLYPYALTITPKYINGDDIVVKVKAWEDTNTPANKYNPANMIGMVGYDSSGYKDGVNKLIIKVGDYNKTALTGGFGIFVPHGEGAMIPANGFLVLAKDKDNSGIAYSHEKNDENLAHKQTVEQLKFNTRKAGGLPNLYEFFLNGGTVYLTSTTGAAAGDVVISEIMWGSDSALADSTQSQWIELHNTTSTAISVGEKKWALVFFRANESLPTATTTFSIGADSAGTAVDHAGTRDQAAGVFWPLTGKGQNGRSDVNPAVEAAAPIIGATIPLISMQRGQMADGTYAPGTKESSWSQSTGPATNFKTGIEGSRIGTPGASPIILPKPPVVETPAPAPVIPAAKASEIMITEIMVDTNSGRLPQWIELTSSAIGKVSLEGWEMVVDNAIDADVLGGGNAITISLDGVMVDVSKDTRNLGKGQSALVVAWAARHSTNIRAERVLNVGAQLGQAGRYQLLSSKGFRITLVPPKQTPIAAFGDRAGNLHEDWELPMSEGTARSSLIRREMDAAGMLALGTDANGWVLASSTALITGQPSYYGDDEDEGTPGQDAGGPLPVELSHFRPARDKATGTVVITWATQSELNNAGFFIKRSNQRKGQFQVINPTMIPGAGTTSEKQTYTYTDMTAQPNVVYYYQIEDVSLDGQRQTLTRGIRLKGHIGAAGKATVIWGELKTSHE